MRTHIWKVFPLALALVGCGSGTTGGARLEGMMDPASLSAARGQAIQVSVTGTSLSTATDASGRFSFAGLKPGDATLRFLGPGFDVSVRVPGLVDRQTLRITVRITEHGCEVRHEKANEITVVGAIAAVGTSSITISGLEIDTDANTRIEDHEVDLKLSDLKVGDIVRVEGQLQAGGKVLAEEIELLVPAGTAEVLLRGTVDSVDPKGAFFTVSGLKIVTNSSTKLANIAAVTDLKMGDRVLVQGTLQSDGSVLARLVVKQQVEEEEEDEMEIEGTITKITPPDTFVVGGKTVKVNASTKFEDDHEGPGGGDEHAITFADLKVGDFVEVEGVTQADGTFLAQKVERKSEEDHHG
ncbi:MAG TPA: DUF5666 domain-containing protein [Myxococcales bacterium]|nr:DUF5666 domain-containing protein [Myxococcales bacterium]